MARCAAHRLSEERGNEAAMVLRRCRAGEGALEGEACRRSEHGRAGAPHGGAAIGSATFPSDAELAAKYWRGHSLAACAAELNGAAGLTRAVARCGWAGGGRAPTGSRRGRPCD